MTQECRKLFPDAQIKQREYIKGKVSGTMREVDISIRQKIGPQEMLLVVDCKDHRRPIDVKTMEAFSGLRGDVGAHAGIIISRAGFTKSALRVAQHRLITTYQFSDGASGSKLPDWIWMAFTLDLWLLTCTSLKVDLPDGTEGIFEKDTDLHVWDSATNKEMPVATILRTFWEKEEVRQEGHFCYSVKGGSTNGQEDHTLHFGFSSKRFHAFRKGKLVFRGLADPSSRKTLSDAYTITLEDKPLPMSGAVSSSLKKGSGLSMVLSSIMVNSSDKVPEKMIALLLTGYLEFQIRTKAPFEWSLPKIIPPAGPA